MSEYNRRDMLKLSGQAFLALSACAPLLSVAASNENSAISWERFLELCHQLSEIQFEPDWNQLKYTQEVQQHLFKLKVDDARIEAIIRRYRNFRKDFPEIRPMHYEQRFMVSMLEFEPGEEIGLHDHPDMTGVTLCLEGSLKVEHYDLLEQRSESGMLLLKEQQKLAMTKGDSAILTIDHGNIHTLKADKFTRLIDVFTPPYNRDRAQRSKYFQKADASYLNQAGVFEAEVI